MAKLRRVIINTSMYLRERAPESVFRITALPGNHFPLGTVLFITVLAGGLIVFLITITTALMISGYYQTTERILPGVHAGRISLGDMTIPEAITILDERWNLDNKILVSNGLQNQLVSPADLGLKLDSLKTAQKAYYIGHGGSFLADTAMLFASLKDGMQVRPVIFLDLDSAREGLEALTPLLSQPAKNANLQLEGDILTPIPCEIGYTINIEETLIELESDPHLILKRNLLQVLPQPLLPEVLDATPALEEAQKFINTPLTISGYDPIVNETLTWPVPRETLITWLAVASGEQGPHVSLIPSQVSAYLSSISESLKPDRYLDIDLNSKTLIDNLPKGINSPVTISHYPSLYIVQPLDTLLGISWKVGMPMWMIIEANPGVNPEGIQAGTEVVIPSKSKLLPLPVIGNKRIVISLSNQRLLAYQDGRVLNKFMISTGIDRSPTQPGIFQVQSHDLNAYASVWDLHMPHFLGIYEAWPGFMNGIHGLPTLSSGRRLWADILGKPASYGCIILDLGAAEWLYNWAEEGVVVEIQP